MIKLATLMMDLFVKEADGAPGTVPGTEEAGALGGLFGDISPLMSAAIGAGVGGIGGYALSSEKGVQETDRDYRNRVLKNALIGAGLAGLGTYGLTYGATTIAKDPIGDPTTAETKAVTDYVDEAKNKYLDDYAEKTVYGAAGAGTIYGLAKGVKRVNGNNIADIKAFIKPGVDPNTAIRTIRAAANGAKGMDPALREMFIPNMLTKDTLSRLTRITGGNTKLLGRALGLDAEIVKAPGFVAKSTGLMRRVLGSKPTKLSARTLAIGGAGAGAVYAANKWLGKGREVVDDAVDDTVKQVAATPGELINHLPAGVGALSVNPNSSYITSILNK
ncbi:MAG: hypothetical protein RR382_00990 [Tannerellaceae bacterium]